MKKLLLLLIPVFALSSCLTTSDSAPAEVSIVSQDLIETGIWTPGASSGSTFTANDPVVVDGEIHVDYVQAKKEKPDQWPDIELVASLPEVDGAEANFAGLKTITFEYKCSEELMVRLNQTDFMAEGDASYALYFTAVLPSEEWKTVTVDVSKFIQPSWAEASTKAIPLKLENVTGIALSPQANYATGEEATLDVRSLVIE